MEVIEAMTHGYQCVQPSDSIQAAAQLMLAHDIGAVLVEDVQGICGIITDRDITCRAVAAGSDPSTPVEACMSRDVLSCYTRDDLYDAVELMMREQVRRLLVLDLDEQPVGILAQADVADAIAPYGLAGEMLQQVSKPLGKHSQ